MPQRSVEENVRLAAPLIDEATLAALFSVLELNAHRSHFPGELSLGLARRVALARALAARLREQIASLVESRTVMTLLVTPIWTMRFVSATACSSFRRGRPKLFMSSCVRRIARSEVDIADIKAGAC